MSPHPVALFGSGCAPSNAAATPTVDDAGALHATIGAGAGVATGVALRSTAAATYLAVGGRALGEAAAQVAAALEAGDLDRARDLLPGLVGRDPSRPRRQGDRPGGRRIGRRKHRRRGGGPGLLGGSGRGVLAPLVTGPSTPSTPWSATAHRAMPTTAGPVPDWMIVAGWVPARVTAALVAVGAANGGRRNLGDGAPRRPRASVSEQRRGRVGVRGRPRPASRGDQPLRRHASSCGPLSATGARPSPPTSPGRPVSHATSASCWRRFWQGSAGWRNAPAGSGRDRQSRWAPDSGRQSRGRRRPLGGVARRGPRSGPGFVRQSQPRRPRPDPGPGRPSRCHWSLPRPRGCDRSLGGCHGGGHRPTPADQRGGRGDRPGGGRTRARMGGGAGVWPVSPASERT